MLSPLDTLKTTQYYKSMLFEIVVIMIAPYPGLENCYYSETYVDFNVTI
jgi:hypothetical protein